MKKYSIMYETMGCKIHYEIQGKCKNGKVWSIYWFNIEDSLYVQKTMAIWSTKGTPISEMDAISHLGHIIESERAYSFHSVFCFFVSANQEYQTLHIPLSLLDSINIPSPPIDRIYWIYFGKDSLEIGFRINRISSYCFEQIKNICFKIQEDYLNKFLQN